MKEIKINIEYPSEIQPGGDRFFIRGLEVSPFKGIIHLEIRCSEVVVTSSQKGENNIITIKGSETIQFIPLHYNVLKAANISTRKELGIFIYKKKILWENIFFIAFLSILWFSPTIILLFRPSIFTFKLGIGAFFVINIPQYVLFALLFNLKRAASIFNKIITYKLSEKLYKDSYGIFDFITITNKPSNSKDNMTFTIK